MSEENEGASRTEEPTQRKLDDARKKGDVVKTSDLAPLLSLFAAAGVVAISGGPLCEALSHALLPFIAHPDTIMLQNNGAVDVARHAMMASLPILAAVLLAAGAAGAAGNLLQTGLMFTPDKLQPDPKKVSPMAGLKRLFGADALIQFGKSILKVLATTAVAWWVLRPFFPHIAELSGAEPKEVLGFSAEVLRRLVFAVGALLLIIAGADWLVQRQRFMARMRMTKEELKEDYKQSEGDPHIKARQKQLRIERARRRMMAAVPLATVVVMNPTHYAVALKYDATETPAPQCVAKGLDSLALKIREVAEAAGVPIIEDPPLARALYAAVDIDDIIPPAHYEAVAKIIGFILNAGRRATARAL